VDSSSRAVLRKLIADQRVLSLPVLVDGKPVLGLLAYVPLPDFSALLVLHRRWPAIPKGSVPARPFRY
jgi:hypothetical protein